MCKLHVATASFCVSSDEATTSDVKGIQTTSAVIVPTSTPATRKMVITRWLCFLCMTKVPVRFCHAV